MTTASAIEITIALACVAMTSLRDSIRSATTPATSPKTVNGMKRQNASAPIASGEPDSSMHEPGERDVLHPRSGERDDLAGEEDAVVAVAAEASERARTERERERRHALDLHEPRERGERCVDRVELCVLERAQPVGEPGRAARADASHQALAFVREPKADAPPVVVGPDALEKPGALEPIDVPGHRGWRDPLLGRELGEREARAALDEPEERRLSCRDAELLRLLAELACEAKEHGAEVGRNGLGGKRNVTNH